MLRCGWGTPFPTTLLVAHSGGQCRLFCERRACTESQITPGFPLSCSVICAKSINLTNSIVQIGKLRPKIMCGLLNPEEPVKSKGSQFTYNEQLLCWLLSSPRSSPFGCRFFQISVDSSCRKTWSCHGRWRVSDTGGCVHAAGTQ